MSDRINDQNIPKVENVTAAELSILDEDNANALVLQQLQAKPKKESHLHRIVQDMSMAFYSRVAE